MKIIKITTIFLCIGMFTGYAQTNRLYEEIQLI